MAGGRVQLRERAAQDIDEALAHLHQSADASVALDLVDELERVMRAISQSPQLGSLSFSVTLSIPELRVIRTRRFPYLVVYVPLVDGVDVWRVLHERRDLPSSFQPD